MTASADNLHLLAHQAQLRARTEGDWWDNPLDTALAAVSTTRHPAAFREHGEAAVDRLRRWSRDGAPRRVSADAAALALAARAAADLARRDRDLEAAAVDAVADLAGRSGPAAPALHLALSTWALDPLVADRDARPWPQLRTHLAGPVRPAPGLEGPLRTLAFALATSPFDASALVRALLSEVPASPGLEDGAVLLWVITAAIERCAPDVDHRDTGLRALTDRRAELAARLAQEVTAEAFQAPSVRDFDAEAELDLRPMSYLSPTEALLLDISLASTESDAAWLRFEEAEQLFGQREREIRRRLARRTAILTAALGAAVAALASVVSAWLGLALDIAVPGAVALGALAWLSATTISYRAEPLPLTQALGTLWATLSLAASVYAVNAISGQPLSDIGGFVAGALVGVAGAVVWNAAIASARQGPT